MSNQFLRKVGLVVSTGSKGLDLSALRIVFQVFAPDVDQPPTALIKIYNLSEATANQVKNEFQSVTLQAGYEQGNYGVIFQGSIIRTRKGKESNVDSFVELMASDLDGWFNYGFVNTTLAKGSSFQKQLDAVQEAATAQAAKVNPANQASFNPKLGYIDPAVGTGGTLPRGKVMFGLGRDKISDVANNTKTSWSIYNGQLNMVALTGYKPGEVVQINSETGMLSIPEATIDGINVTCLLNPKITPYTRVQINNKDITTSQNQSATFQGEQVPIGYPNVTGLQFFASISDDGIYRVIVAEHAGDSWGVGNDWVTHLICLKLDQSASPSNSVQAYPGQQPTDL